MSATIQQNQSLCKELETAIKLLQAGCREVQNIDGLNDFYHLPMLTLANGLERFMKVIICLHILEIEGDYPTKAPWKKDHDLSFLLNKVVTDCFPNNYIMNIPAASADMEYLRNNNRLREILGLLSDFGRATRYYNLDLVMGKNQTGDSPDDVWAKLELAILKEDTNWEKNLMKDIDLSQSYNKINHAIVYVIERFARALSRLFTIGELGTQARRFSPIVYPFLMLQDDQLGNTKY